ncbi:AAEL017146-PA [Aedes aegypti]|uniref:AAEL017146-PA n=1 Tax=Aedes aegypti TaxID=7159 RepID=J9E9A6_AEDAE|nr:AAEL017146-PA [Aedes aegypti]
MFRHGMSSVCKRFRVEAGRMWSSCSCSRPVHLRWSWYARNCTSSHRDRHGCCAPKSNCRSRRMSTDATSTDRH